ncbi:hypothetical protein F5X68DRAFT_240974 [Plectosphaerella plurivora]|uniref:Uncharacterized protein n=1 Tax=Plectosphaerella plurivora TaxID=936078 RepID=A0A9P9AAU8_9PEZI|nr:hypothetical protein F5X68DRAFT_240974 [Plectosphaerella plurivora]
MAPSEPVGDSAAARQRGNDFYRKGQFAQAEKAYTEAARLASEDPAPWSNMSAIKFELGDWSVALANLDKALALSSDEPDDGPKKQKLYTRMAKCHFHALSLDKAAAAAQHLGDDDASKSLRLAITDAQKLWSALPDEAAFRKQVFDPFAEMKVIESIRTLIDELEKDKDQPATNVLDMLWTTKATRDQVLRKLKQWVEPLGDGYTTKQLREPNIQRFMRTEMQMSMALGMPPPESDSTQNRRDFRAFGVVFPNNTFLERREPELLPLIEAYRKSGSGTAAKQALATHLDDNWRINMTLLDMDYESRRLRENSNSGPLDLLPVLDWDPNTMAEWLQPGSSKSPRSEGLFEDMSTFFEILAVSALSHLGRLQIGLIAGEMAEVMERIRYDSLEHRSPSVKARTPVKRPVDPSRFPRVYDRIHMSNIPDYVGGPLTAHMYAGPLLRPDRPSNLRFNNLLNPPMFDDHDQFLAEYVLMHDERRMVDHFGLTRKNTLEKNEQLEQLMQTFLPGSAPGFGIEDYFIRAPAGPKRVPRARLMSRPALEHWPHAHLLKICLPHSRPVYRDRPVHAPLNLTAFLRLLSGVVEAAAAGAITTTARPPRRLVLTVDDPTKAYPQRRISLGPWKAEFTTLLGSWRRLLGFGIVAPRLPAADAVMECAVAFPEFPHEVGRVPHFVVAFIRNDVVESLGSLHLPEMIQDDEQGDASPGAKTFRETGCHLVTAFRYVTDTRTATLWMREDVAAEMMRDNQWWVCMWRTDV